NFPILFHGKPLCASLSMPQMKFPVVLSASLESAAGQADDQIFRCNIRLCTQTRMMAFADATQDGVELICCASVQWIIKAGARRLAAMSGRSDEDTGKTSRHSNRAILRSDLRSSQLHTRRQRQNKR